MALANDTSDADAFATYESLKRAWMAAHPAATPEQIEAACRTIADEVGI